ncbi:MAG: toll/interleukin-1 receptor domain-containing protein [Bacteroidales bacterium]|nr:toll/interleukin-1 receptor domain-containing protein [Bacteroidales bacterium]
MDKKYDIFISHASEDKDAIVRPMATILERMSVRVWYDEFSLQPGDSLTASIDRGLQESKYGLVVLSKAFLAKKWTDYEYRSLMTREIDGERVILPLWYDVTKEDVKSFSLYLADIMALPISRANFGKIVPAILKKVRPEIYQELRMRGVLRKAVAEGTPKLAKMSEIKSATTKHSKLTKQQLIRSKAVYYGIGKHLNKTFYDYVDQYELDVVPERELQSWEIMNACYLEMLEHHSDATVRDREDYFKVLLALSIGYSELTGVQLSDGEIDELVALWKENYYEF